MTLRSLLAAGTPRPWYARGRQLSRVPDSSGMGGTLPTNHLGVTAERDDASLIVAAVNEAEALLDENERLRALVIEACDLGDQCTTGGQPQPEIHERLATIRAEVEGK